MTVAFVVGGWVVLNLAIFIALLLRRDPEIRAKLMDWMLPSGERQRRAALKRPVL
jgi:hypothetical protein